MENNLYNSSSRDFNYLYRGQNPGIDSSNEIIQRVDFPTTSELYNAVFENSFHPVYIGDGDEHIFRFNEKFSKLFGYTRSELLLLDSSLLFDVNEQAFLDFMNERDRKRIAKYEITGIRKSGIKFPCRVSSVVYLSENGEKRSMNTIVDISKDIEARWALMQ
jgi:PAS domain S-box-containing protein